MNIVHQKFTQAQVLYDSAFVLEAKKFSKDYYNALVCSIINKDVSKTEKYIHVLLERGTLIESIKNDTLINSVVHLPFWTKIENTYPAVRKQITKKLNYPLAKELEFLVARDQHMRGRPGSYKVWGDTIRTLDVLNYDRLATIFKTNGFPDESLIGNENPRAELPYYVILRHWLGDSKDCQCEDFLKKAVLEGNFHAKYYAWIRDYEYSGRHKSVDDFGVTLFYEVDGKLYPDKPSEKQKVIINTNRASIGLESLDDYQQKVLYERNDKRFVFANTSSIATMYFTNEQDKKAFIEGFK